MDNLHIYNSVRVVPKEAQKAFDNGSFKGTDINPMFRIKKLTEIFGPAGIGWYTEVLEHWEEEVNGEILTNVALNLYVKYEGEWSKPIYGIGGNKALQQFSKGPKVSDEAYKMAYTDALSVASKALGIGADIYWQTDPTKYSPRQAAPEPVDVPEIVLPSVDTLIGQVEVMTSAEEVKGFWNAYKDRLSPGDKAKLLRAVMDNPACQRATEEAKGRTRRAER